MLGNHMTYPYFLLLAWRGWGHQNSVPRVCSNSLLSFAILSNDFLPLCNSRSRMKQHSWYSVFGDLSLSQRPSRDVLGSLEGQLALDDAHRGHLLSLCDNKAHPIGTEVEITKSQRNRATTQGCISQTAKVMVSRMEHQENSLR